MFGTEADIPPPEAADDSPMLPRNDPQCKDIPEASLIKTECLKVMIITKNNFDVIPCLIDYFGQSITILACGNCSSS